MHLKLDVLKLLTFICFIFYRKTNNKSLNDQEVHNHEQVLEQDLGSPDTDKETTATHYVAESGEAYACVIKKPSQPQPGTSSSGTMNEYTEVNTDVVFVDNELYE